MKAVVPGSACQFRNADHPVKINIIHRIQLVRKIFNQHIVGTGIRSHAGENGNAGFFCQFVNFRIKKDLSAFIIITNINIVYLGFNGSLGNRNGGLIKRTCRVDDNINLFKGRYHGVMLVDIHFNKGDFFIFPQFGGQSFRVRIEVRQDNIGYPVIPYQIFCNSLSHSADPTND